MRYEHRKSLPKSLASGVFGDDLRELLRYMNSVADFPIDKTDNELIHKIDRAVDVAKQSDEWRRAHMNYLLQQRDAEKRGEAKGRAEGEEKKAHDMAKNLYALGVSVENIAQAAGCTVEKIRCWLDGVPA